MPRIKASTLEAHSERIWHDITQAIRELLVERDFSTVTLGHIAEKAGIARNTLYNYANDKPTLVLSVVERVSQPVIERISGIGDREGPATRRVEDLVSELTHASTDPTIRLMFELTPGPSVPAALLNDREGPFGQVAVAMERILHDGIARAEFRSDLDVPLTSWLLGGIVRSAAECMVLRQVGPDEITPAAQQLILAAIENRTSTTAG